MNHYDKYKKISVSWGNKVPLHWNVVPLFKVCKEKYIKNIGFKEKNILSLSYGNIVDKRNADFGLSPKDYATYQIVSPNDIILRLTDLQNDKKSLRTGIVRKKGIITSAYICIFTNQNPFFIHYFLHFFDSIKLFYGLGGGVRQSLGYDDIKYINIPLPSIEEQNQIVRFLDDKLGKIDRLIAIKQRQIGLLKENRQVIIQKAVTKGINPNVKMKESGIAWLGKIPDDWELTTISQCFDIVLGKMLQPSKRKDSNIYAPYLCSKDIKEQKVNIDDLKSMWFSEKELKKYLVKKDDLLVVEGGNIGNSAIYEHDKEVFFQNSILRLRNKFMRKN